MSGDKTEWPTRAKITRLRSEGVVAYSSFLTRTALLVVVLFILAALTYRLPQLVDMTTLSFEKSVSGMLPAESLSQTLQSGVEWILILTGMALITALMTILVQSRFLFAFSLISFQPQRVAAFLKLNFLGALLSLFAGVVKLMLALVIGVTITWWYAYDLLVLFNLERKEWPASLEPLPYRIISGVGVVMLGLASLGYCWARLIFMFNNQMSRREVDSESD